MEAKAIKKGERQASMEYIRTYTQTSSVVRVIDKSLTFVTLCNSKVTCA